MKRRTDGRLTVLGNGTAWRERREISIKPVLDATVAFDQEAPIDYPLSVSDQSHLLCEHLSRTAFQGTRRIRHVFDEKGLKFVALDDFANS